MLNSLRRRPEPKPEPLASELPGPFHRTRSIFIHVPKAAGTSISLALYGYSVGHTTICKHFERDPEAARDYFKFTLVRDPVDRLVSTYLFFRAGGMHVRDREYWEHYGYGRDFDTFVRSLQEEGALERHILLRPQMHFIATPDKRVLVNFVGRYENIEKDFAHVAETIGVKAELPHRNKTIADDFDVDIRTRFLIKEIYEVDYTWLSY